MDRWYDLLLIQRLLTETLSESYSNLIYSAQLSFFAHSTSALVRSSCRHQVVCIYARFRETSPF